MLRVRNLDDEQVQTILKCNGGLAQETNKAESNLGYGYFYYSMVRLLRPKTILIIGSGYGFTPVILATATKHNGSGRVIFVDPSMSMGRDGLNVAHGGRGNWDTPEKVKMRFDCAGVADRIQHLKMRNDEFFPRFPRLGIPRPDFIVIDGAHDYKNVAYDFVEATKLINRPGYILLHDSAHFFNRTGHMGVHKLVNSIRGHYDAITLPGVAGLTMVRVVDAKSQLTPLSMLPF